MHPCEIVSRETLSERKEIFRDQLSYWNKKINLVEKGSLRDFDKRHWEDSLQLLDYIHFPESHILDLGSGGGFPGIVLGIHGFNITLTETVKKKTVFLREIIRRCKLENCIVAEDAKNINNFFDYVTARAFSELKTLLRCQVNVSRETTKGLYLKGKSYFKELEEASKEFSFNTQLFPSQTCPDGVIIEISNLIKK